MFPSDLKREHFRDYPPLARKLVTANLAALSRLPLSFLPSLLREAIEYDFKLPPEPPAIRRLGITVVGQGANSSEGPLFRRLRPHGAYFTHVNPENGLQQLLGAAAARAKAHPASYGHWYIDGGQEAPFEGAFTRVSYQALEP